MKGIKILKKNSLYFNTFFPWMKESIAKKIKPASQ